MTALLLGWSARLPGQLQAAVLHAVAALQGVLAATAEAAGPAARSPERTAEVWYLWASTAGRCSDWRSWVTS